MPGNSAYYVPTPEAALTTVAGRALQGLGCGTCQRTGMSFYLPGVPSPALLSGTDDQKRRFTAILPMLAGIGDRLPPMLSGLGAGAGSGRYNRAVDRRIYDLPFIEVPAQGARGLGRLGQLTVDPRTLLLGIGLLAGAMFFFGVKKGPRIRHRRAARLRVRRARIDRRLRELEA